MFQLTISQVTLFISMYVNFQKNDKITKTKKEYKYGFSTRTI